MTSSFLAFASQVHRGLQPRRGHPWIPHSPVGRSSEQVKGTAHPCSLSSDFSVNGLPKLAIVLLCYSGIFHSALE